MVNYNYMDMYKTYLKKTSNLIEGKDGNLYRGLYKYEPHIIRTQAYCLRRAVGAQRYASKEEVIDLDRLKRWYKAQASA